MKVSHLKISFCTILVALLFLILCFGCSSAGSGSSLKTSDQTQHSQDAVNLKQEISISCGLHKHPDYDYAVLDMTLDKFVEAGFEYGDCLDVVFNNGYALSAIPFYNGYHVRNGQALVLGTKDDNSVLVAIKNEELMIPARLNGDSEATITLNKKAKFLNIHKALGQDYSTDASDYSNQEQFSNFRAMRGGQLKDNFVYRGASPVNNVKNRATVTDSLLERNGIKCVVDFADTEEMFDDFATTENFSSNYVANLKNSGCVACVRVDANYASETYKANVAKGLNFMVSHGSPAYVNCVEGKDRTGFVAILIESLAGATYDEMLDDYMLSYENYYGLTKENNLEGFEETVSLYFNSCLEYLTNDAEKNLKDKNDFAICAKSYLISAGMTEKEIDDLVAYLTV